ncbi:glycosyltransferase family 2 protein [Thalassospira lohafexi]|uniref:Glycosyl transferase family 2 n=1 Tax=Thalassospira lohafexi TaxID=744227 RepID=A0A2N3L6N8_9PROT|nr:glycosyltransferase family 2 protein [Thalassospira lohafexi]PKR58533.1 glycosyl transferase family 2 [Thalassospira lohafexi]
MSVLGSKTVLREDGLSDTAATGVSILLDVVIVNYNTYDDTFKCVTHLIEQHEVAPQNIHVVDNCSLDGSGPRLKRDLPAEVDVILSQTNNGFGAGINLGARAGEAPYILVLNPDCRPETANLHLILEHFILHADVGLVGAELINPDGSLQYSARTFYSALDVIVRRSPLRRIFPFSRVNRSHLLMGDPRSGPFDVDWVMGTGFVVRREVFERVGAMDEAYFLYMDDVDLCARVHSAGFRVQILPIVKFVHDHRRQSGWTWRWTRSHSLHLASFILFTKRHGLSLFRRPKIRQYP